MSLSPAGIADAAERAQALDVTRSFIVQAPAGSGKTELLTQRVLALLAQVDAPEEIIAITFTRKAAAEMRARIMEKLHGARAVANGEQPAPSKAHEQTTFQLAMAALERDQQQGWQLLHAPGRLKVHTIDALCASLARQMPLLSRLGGGVAPSDRPKLLYQEAVRRTLAGLEQGAPHAAAIRTMLLHLDNQWSALEQHLVAMLGRRDQWLPLVARDLGAARHELEGVLHDMVRQQLQQAADAWPERLQQQILPLARKAAAHLALSKPGSAIMALHDRDQPLGTDLADIQAWLGLADLLLTQGGTWRLRLDKNGGFPADDKPLKQAMMALLGELQADGAARETLAALRQLPATQYLDEKWEVLQALLALLKVAAAQLWLVFAERGSADFAELQQRALDALQDDEEQPTDLALQLDYRLRHLLVDEFQDTSLPQGELLLRLTAGWEVGDGRTLFVVGDPMQSIYRFRMAEVGLFLQIREHGLGQVPLTPLTLSVNFRSVPGVVDWVNQHFCKVLPTRSDPLEGAVPYSPSSAARAPGEGMAVTVHALDGDRRAEAVAIADLVQQTLARQPDWTIAVLVRSRPALGTLMPEFKQRGLPYVAVEIDQLTARQSIDDLIALTRAALVPGDRVHWLAVLRAPWCGLTWNDLHALCGDQHQAALWRLMQDDARVQRLSEDGQHRLRWFREQWRQALPSLGSVPLRDWLEGLWRALLGPACLTQASDLADVQAYFDLLERLDAADELDLDGLEDATATLFASPDSSPDARVQLMTIHKSKGLEFDLVIVPGLERRPRNPDTPALLWQHLATPDGRQGLLLAPIKDTGGTEDPIYGFVKRLQAERDEREIGRLLYVAATRAKQELHWFGGLKPAAGGDLNPPSRSLLATLWPAVADAFRQQLLAQLGDAAAESASAVSGAEGAGNQASGKEGSSKEGPGAAMSSTLLPPLRRLPLQAMPWTAPPASSSGAVPADAPSGSGAVADRGLPGASDVASETDSAARVRGILVHRVLQQLIQRTPLPSTLEADGVAWRPLLTRLAQSASSGGAGMRPEALADQALALVEAALSCVRMQWLLQPHAEGRAEWSLQRREPDGTISVHVIDRSFVEQGVRWIVDYKTGHPGDMADAGQRQAWLEEQLVAHRPQLERYRDLVAAIDPRPIRLGLYFVALRHWVELG